MKEKLTPYLTILPSILFLLAIIIYPLLYSLRISFYNLDLSKIGSGSFIGFENYIKLFTDIRFLSSIRTTLTFVCGVITLEFILGLGLALVLNQEIRGRGIFRTIFIIPMMMAPAVVGLMWRFMYHPQVGIIPYLFTVLQLPTIHWLSDTRFSLLALIIVDLWQWMPFIFLILLAGLQGLPKTPFEAAEIDGASRFKKFRYITLPLLKNSILVALLLRTIDAFKIFDLVYIVTRGGPSNSTETLSYYNYLKGFKWFSMGYASAMSYIILIIIILLSQLYLRTLREKL